MAHQCAELFKNPTRIMKVALMWGTVSQNNLIWQAISAEYKVRTQHMSEQDGRLDG